jgi:hypothetical protein
MTILFYSNHEKQDRTEEETREFGDLCRGFVTELGGEGSGYGNPHRGRSGQVGGSLPRKTETNGLENDIFGDKKSTFDANVEKVGREMAQMISTEFGGAYETLEKLQAIKDEVDAHRSDLVWLHQNKVGINYFVNGTHVFPGKEADIKVLTLDFNNRLYAKLIKAIEALSK